MEQDIATIVPDEQLFTATSIPVIVENLRAFKANIESQVAAARALPVEEDTVKEVKRVRTELTSKFNVLEGMRKSMQRTINEPYEAFKVVYDECVTDTIKAATDFLGVQITSVESGVKDKKRKKVEAYYNELCAARHIDFLPFERMNMNVLLTTTEAALKKEVDLFVNRVADEIKLIDKQEDSLEVLAEYTKTLNVAKAVEIVTERKAAVERARQITERNAQIEAERLQAIENAKGFVVEVPPEAPVIVEVEPDEDEIPVMAASFSNIPVMNERFTVKFAVTGTIPDLKLLKQFMQERGMTYEQLSQ